MTQQERQNMPPWDSNLLGEIKLRILRTKLYADEATKKSGGAGWWFILPLPAGEMLHEVERAEDGWFGKTDSGDTVFVPFADGEEWA